MFRLMVLLPLSFATRLTASLCLFNASLIFAGDRTHVGLPVLTIKGSDVKEHIAVIQTTRVYVVAAGMRSRSAKWMNAAGLAELVLRLFGIEPVGG